MSAPRVFISYSHDSDEHKRWVQQLASDLRAGSVDATLDQWDLAPGQDVAAFMNEGITESDRVLLICTAEYVAKLSAGSGGVGYERLVVTAEVVQNIETKKFIPIVRANPAEVKVPSFLGPRLYIDFSNQEEYDIKLDELLRELHGVPGAGKPPIGPMPFSGTAPPPPASSGTGPSGLTAAGARVLDGDWFEGQAATARAGISELNLRGAMELRFALHEPVGKSQVELLDAVRNAETRTFGWPIGIVLDNRDEYRPVPEANGIRAEIPIEERLSGSPSYDYWAAHVNGDFYLLQSLFEDARSAGKLFFNTRIVRVTESLLFCASFYENLGVAHDARVSIRVTHTGLRGRELTSSSPNRNLRPASASAESSETEFVSEVGELKAELWPHVRRITAPMFMLFDFKELGDEIYESIVSEFVRGHVT